MRQAIAARGDERGDRVGAAHRRVPFGEPRARDLASQRTPFGARFGLGNCRLAIGTAEGNRQAVNLFGLSSVDVFTSDRALHLLESYRPLTQSDRTIDRH